MFFTETNFISFFTNTLINLIFDKLFSEFIDYISKKKFEFFIILFEFKYIYNPYYFILFILNIIILK